jgi:hypothetical protein
VKKYFILKNILTVVGIIAGYFYWHFYACTEGCTLTSSWYGSMLIGGVFGNLIGGIITDLQNKE